MTIGIDKIGFATSQYVLKLQDLAEARGVDPEKFSKGLLLNEISIAPLTEDIVTLAASASNSILSDKEKSDFYETLFPLMTENMQRVTDDLEWFCDKFDYKNKDADWKTSKDAIPRGMQKAAGSYPADPPYKSAL